MLFSIFLLASVATLKISRPYSRLIATISLRATSVLGPSGPFVSSTISIDVIFYTFSILASPLIYTITSVSLIKARISGIIASLLIRCLSPIANPPEAIAAQLSILLLVFSLLISAFSSLAATFSNRST